MCLSFSAVDVVSERELAGSKKVESLFFVDNQTCVCGRMQGTTMMMLMLRRGFVDKSGEVERWEDPIILHESMDQINKLHSLLSFHFFVVVSSLLISKTFLVFVQMYLNIKLTHKGAQFEILGSSFIFDYCFLL